jgi:hypothetical protein
MPEKPLNDFAPSSSCADAPPPVEPSPGGPGARSALRCAFCGVSDDVESCEFAVWDFVPSTYAHLSVGDKVHRICEKLLRPAATVAAIKIPSPVVRLSTVRVVLRKSNGHEIEREVYARSPVKVLRDENCDTPACWRHRCERGPGATFCAKHWTSLEYSLGAARDFRASADEVF